MADDKKTDTVIQLVAVDRGFVNGRMVEPGRSFSFDTVGADGKPRKIPKWAAKDGDNKQPKGKPKFGDLKPLDAQLAVKNKIDALSNPA